MSLITRKGIGLLCFNLLIASCLVAQQQTIQVLFFLLEECKISQAYVPEINAISNDYISSGFSFQAIFPSKESSEQSVALFAKHYNLKLECRTDSAQLLATKNGIEILPTVVVLDQEKNQMLYHGRIDDWFVRVGKRRARAQVHDLRDALEAIAFQKPKPPHGTQPVGCFLQK